MEYATLSQSDKSRAYDVDLCNLPAPRIKKEYANAHVVAAYRARAICQRAYISEHVKPALFAMQAGFDAQQK